tara:strand:+ start:628 stop:2073 length:1446 start_codon:yes stop_codon:yes gene_type:complete
MTKKTPIKLQIIDDETSIIEAIKSVLDPTIYEFICAKDGKEGLQQFLKQGPDITVVDFNMPSMNGVEFVKAAQSINTETPIIVMTAYGNRDLNVSFLKEGAFRYLEKPFDIDEFKLIIEDALKQKKLINENKTLQQILTLNKEFPEIIGKSKTMHNLFNAINQVAKTDATILIQGESGTGKELIANAIHEKSLFSSGPFIRFNCAALPETLMESELFGHEKGAFTGADQQKLGRFELAEKGTIFLDEVGELSLSMQVKLLRVLQEKEFERVGGTKVISCDVRILAATNKNLLELSQNQEFREDLYYRLSVFPIETPPLRKREGDIPILAEFFLKKYAKRYNKRIKGFAKQTLEKLETYPWYGNVRELENIVSRAVILCENDLIRPDHICLQTTSQKSFLGQALENNWNEEQLVKEYAKLMFAKHNYNKKKTCEELGITFRTLVARINEQTDNNIDPKLNDNTETSNNLAQDFTQLNFVDTI